MKELKRSYMILAGNLRTYHSRGSLKFEKAFTQKIASDYRILAYQLKLIAYILRDFHINDDNIKMLYLTIRDYYEAIFNAFLKQNEKPWLSSYLLSLNSSNN